MNLIALAAVIKKEGGCNTKGKSGSSLKKKKKGSTQVPTTPRKKNTAHKRSRKKSEDIYDPKDDDEGAFTPQSRKSFEKQGEKIIIIKERPISRFN